MTAEIGDGVAVQRLERQAELLAKARELAPLLDLEAPKGERQGRLTDPVLDALLDGGFMGMVAPRELGGDGLAVVQWLQVLEEMARVDSATAWCLMVLSAHAGMFASYLGEEAVSELYADGIPRIAGSPAPRGRAERVEGGHVFTGKHQFASGGAFATHFTAGGIVHEGGRPVESDDGQPLLVAVVVPREEVTDTGNWDVYGLQATGSHDYEISEVFVPTGRSMVFNPWPAGRFERGARYWEQGFDAHGPALHSPLALGMAQRALEEVAQISKTRKRLDGAYPTVADQPMFQHDISLLDAELSAARAWFYEVIGDNGRHLEAHGGPLPTALLQRSKRAARHVHDVAIRAVDFAYEWSGSSGLRRGSAVGRLFQNMHAANLHLVVDRNIAAVAAPTVLEALIEGRRTLGLD